jgi:hypothetical protein
MNDMWIDGANDHVQLTHFDEKNDPLKMTSLLQQCDDPLHKNYQKREANLELQDIQCAYDPQTGHQPTFERHDMMTQNAIIHRMKKDVAALRVIKGLSYNLCPDDMLALGWLPSQIEAYFDVASNQDKRAHVIL